MPIKVRWDDEDQTIVLFTFIGRWTWQEYDQAIYQAAEMIKDRQTPVFGIVDVTETAFLPENVLRRGINIMIEAKFDTLLSVVITESRFVEMIVQIFGRINRQLSMRLVARKTMEEARDLIAQEKRRLSGEG